MPAIELRDVHKTFRIPHEVHTTLTERILSGFRGTTYERFEALNGVDLTVERGRFVGIIGGNGSGKSTLLKIISGLLPPDRGEVHVDGTMSALLELGLGFSNELTVRENVELYAAVLGYPRREAARRVDEAIAFADLERFRDAKLKNLSTGMRARLGFATALQSESDIMLLDEILAVGDADFQLKCLGVFEDFKHERRTMVLVTHDLAQVQRFCDEAVLLQAGRIVARGDPDAVITRYLSSIGQAEFVIPPDAAPATYPNARVRVRRAWVEDPQGQTIGRVQAGERAVVVVHYEVVADVREPVLGIAIKTELGETVWSVNSYWDEAPTGDLVAGQRVELRVPFVAALRNGRYSIQAGSGAPEMAAIEELVDLAATVVVHGSPARSGVVDLLGRVACRVIDPAAEAAPRAAARRLKGGAR